MFRSLRWNGIHFLAVCKPRIQYIVPCTQFQLQAFVVERRLFRMHLQGQGNATQAEGTYTQYYNILRCVCMLKALLDQLRTSAQRPCGWNRRWLRWNRAEHTVRLYLTYAHGQCDADLTLQIRRENACDCSLVIVASDILFHHRL
jgi:hypothetical protein